MKQLVGVDRGNLYREAIHFLGRLDFADDTTVLAHVMEPVWIPVPVMSGAIGASVLSPGSVDRSYAARLLDEAKQAASAAFLGEDCQTFELEGNPGISLISVADAEKVDLIAVGSRRRGALASVFLGSVGRALAIEAHQSFLIAREGFAAKGPVKAVFATDHSVYADRCFDELLRLDPKGLADITIFSATGYDPLDEGMGEDLFNRFNLRTPEDRTRDRLRELMQAHGQEMVTKLYESGRTGEFQMVDDYPIEGIHRAMRAAKADLLIMGARGHGLVERLMIGSLSLHMVVAEPFSLLVMRVPEEKAS